MFIVSPSPHVRADSSTSKIMFDVVIALVPAFLVAVAVFGIAAAKVTLAAVFFCLLFEYLIQKFFLKGSLTITDGSAVISGILLAFNVPAGIPLWIIAIGSLVTIGVAKMSYGGLGKNPFNPAIVGRLFMMISFPVQMSTWVKPSSWNFIIDGTTSATTLGMLKQYIKMGKEIPSFINELPSYKAMFLGEIGGCIGEVSALAIIIGGLYMLIKKVISWHIPFAYLVTVFLISYGLSEYDPLHYAKPLVHLLSGGLMLGAFFMATDYVTSPMTAKGKLLFGFGCGLITVLIRNFGVYPEGVAFSILIMNAFVPLIDTACKPRVFGIKGGK